MPKLEELNSVIYNRFKSFEIENKNVDLRDKKISLLIFFSSPKFFTDKEKSESSDLEFSFNFICFSIATTPIAVALNEELILGV